MEEVISQAKIKLQKRIEEKNKGRKLIIEKNLEIIDYVYEFFLLKG